MSARAPAYAPFSGYNGATVNAVGGLALTDSRAPWPGTITLTQTYDYDHTDSGGNRTQKSGTATFTWTRTHLADLPGVHRAKLPLFFGEGGSSLGGLGIAKTTFAAAQYAVGNLPGWLFGAGTPDPVTGAFTTVYTPATPPGGGSAPPPTTSHFDAYGSLYLSCGQSAPGRTMLTEYSDTSTIYTASSNVALGINRTIGHSDTGYVYGASYTVVSLVPGSPATGNTPAVLPVYRVSIPTGAMFVAAFSVVVNGRTTTANSIPPTIRGTLQTVLAGLVNQYGQAPAATFYPRSPWVCDVQMAHLVDTLAAGTISYNGAQAATSTYTPGQSLNGLPAPYPQNLLSDPFNLPGQSYTYTNDATGLTTTIQF